MKKLVTDSQAGEQQNKNSHIHYKYTRRGVIKLVAVGAASLLAGCTASSSDPEALAVEPNPEIICECTTIVVRWEVSAPEAVIELLNPETKSVRSRVELNPSEPTADEPTSGDTETVEICEDTILRLVARWGESEDRLESGLIRVVPEGSTREINLSALGQCVDGTPRWVAEPILWDENLRVVSVGNSSGQTLTIAHNGVQVTVPALEVDSTFAGQHPGGQWELQPVSLSPGSSEACRGGEVEGGSSALGTAGPITITVEC